MEKFDEDVQATLLASRPIPDMQVAREAGEVIAHMLGDGRSTIDPNTTIWTADAAEALRGRIGDNPIVGADQGQWDKLDLQLQDAPRAVVLLAAELVFLREHALRSALPDTRRAHVERVLSHLDVAARVPESMATWLARPAGSAGFEPGSWYNGALWRHIIWASTFVRHWSSIPEADREVARTDPWALQQLMLGSGQDRSDIRNALQFLARPDDFEPIASAGMKSKIRAALADRIGGSTGDDPASVDRDLLAIRAALASEIGGPFHFWSPGVAELWDPSDIHTVTQVSDSIDLNEPRSRHYWLYSPGARASEWAEFSANSIMALGWDDLDDLSTYPNREAIRQVLDTEKTGGSMKNGVLALWQFQNEMAVGDIVFAKRGRREIVGRGEVTSAARYEPERPSFRHVRSVKWTDVGSWEHPGDAVTKTLTDITTYHDYGRQARSALRRRCGTGLVDSLDSRPDLRQGRVPHRGLYFRGTVRTAERAALAEEERHSGWSPRRG